MTVLDIISCVHLALSVIMLPKQLKYATFSSCFDLSQSALGMVAIRFSLLSFYHIPFQSTISSLWILDETLYAKEIK
jgi:antibiotic biosynthesis monooxygenase (ABM) superfamily enzyme